MRRAGLALVAMLAVLGMTAGCAALPGLLIPTASSTPPVPAVSNSATSAYGKQAVCALGSAGISLIRAGGAGSKALAEIIAANVQDPNIKNMANAVMNSTAGDDVRNQLADWLTSYCGS